MIHPSECPITASSEPSHNGTIKTLNAKQDAYICEASTQRIGWRKGNKRQQNQKRVYVAARIDEDMLAANFTTDAQSHPS